MQKLTHPCPEADYAPMENNPCPACDYGHTRSTPSEMEMMDEMLWGEAIDHIYNRFYDIISRDFSEAEIIALSEVAPKFYGLKPGYDPNAMVLEEK